MVSGAAAGSGQVDSTSIPVNIAGNGTLVVTPNPALAGQTVAIAAAGFTPGEQVIISLDYVDAGTHGGALAGASSQADQGGKLDTDFALPATVTGGFTATVDARGSVSGIVLSRDVFIHSQPKIALDPPGAPAGSNVTVKGSGFAPGERVYVTAQAFSAPSGGVVADASGSFTDTTSVRSLASAGVYLVGASGILGHSASSELTVPRVRVPTSGVAAQSPVVDRTFFAEGFTGDGPAVHFGESLYLLNTASLTATGSIQYFIGMGITKTVSITVPAHAVLSENVGQDVGKNQTVSAMLELPSSISVTRTITRTTDTGQSLASSISSGESALANTWYFAEGYTGATFQEYLAILNPGASPAQVTVELFGPDSSSPEVPTSVTVAPHSRVTLNMRAVAPGRSIGLLLTSDQPVASERVLYWGDGTGSAKYGSAVSGGVLGPAATWTFPYVSTAGGDQAYLSFIDPSSVAAHVQFTELGDRAGVALPTDLTIQPGTRATLQIMAGSSSIGGSAAVVVHADVPIVSEQAEYFGGSPNTGSHTGSILSGAEPTSQWAFPSLDSDGFTSDMWYVANTGPKNAQLTATIYSADGQNSTVKLVAPSGRLARLSLDESKSGHVGAPVVWNSDGPVSIIRLVRAAGADVADIIAGMAISQNGP